jgi:hypothetical protein
LPLALDEERREIEQKIRAAEHRLELITKWAVRPDDLLQVLNEYRPQIVPPDGAELWAWLHWTGDADVDLHVTPARSRTKEDIFWNNSEIRGIPAKMLCWGSYSGTPEVFFVEKNSTDFSGYEFSAKPDEGQTQGRIP